MSDQGTKDEGKDKGNGKDPGGLSNRAIVGLVIGALLIVFIAFNRDETEISFIAFTARASLWVALALAGGAGFFAGFLLGRKRYRQ